MLLYIVSISCIMVIFLYISDSLLIPRFKGIMHKILLLISISFCTFYMIVFDFIVCDKINEFNSSSKILVFTTSYTLVLFVLYKDRLYKMVTFSILCVSLNVFSNIVSSFYVLLYHPKSMSLAEYLNILTEVNVIPLIISFATMISLARLLIGYFKKVPSEIPSAYWYLLAFLELLIIIASGLLDDMLQVVSTTTFNDGYFNIIFVILMIVSIALFSGISEFYTQKQQFILLSAQNEALSLKLETQYKMNETTKQLKHEMNSVLTVIYTHLENKDYDKIKKIVVEKIQLLTKKEYENYTNNHLIDALLNYKIIEIQKIGIPIETKFSHLNIEIPFEPLDICSILFNLIDNAIEANMRMEKNLEQKFIYIKICTYKQYLTIVVRNAYNGKINLYNKKIKTSKSDSFLHGYGLTNIELCVTKYNGIFDYTYDDREFTAKTMLPLRYADKSSIRPLRKLN